MKDLGINLSAYASGNLDNRTLFDNAATSPEALADLSKALGAGSITGRETTNSASASGAPLKVESLDKNLKHITFKDSDIVLWRRIPKLAAYNTVEEYLQLQSYGQDRGGFNNEGELPQTEDSVYVRRAQLVKFLGVTKEVTHPMQLVNTNIGPIMQREITNGTLWILRKANRALTTGNANIIPQEFNGLYAQHESNDAFTSKNAYFNSEVVVDLRGAALSETAIENAANGIIENFGQGDLLMAPPRVLTDFVKGFYGNKYIPVNGSGITDGKMGQRINSFASQYGDIELAFDKFMNPGAPRTTASAATSTLAPAVVVGTDAALVADTDQKWSDSYGDYFYGVAAVNRYGESQIVGDATAVSVIATKSVDITFTDGGGANPATGYVIYRSAKNPTGALAATTLYPIYSVSIAEQAAGYDGAGVGVVRDKNRFIQGCYQAFLIQNDEEAYAFKQLAPLMKMDLATLSPSSRFMILMYGTPMLYAPKKMVRFINIGRAS